MTSATAPRLRTNRTPAASTTPDAATSRALLGELAAALEEQRSTLLGRVTRLGIDIEQLQTLTATHGQGETEHATSASERAVAEALEAGTLQALEEIAFALARMDDGSYGICVSCSVPIGVERLRAMPQTQLCVTCQHAHERELL
jgi:DnaK suppressor protein